MLATEVLNTEQGGFQITHARSTVPCTRAASGQLTPVAPAAKGKPSSASDARNAAYARHALPRRVVAAGIAPEQALVQVALVGRHRQELALDVPWPPSISLLALNETTPACFALLPALQYVHRACCTLRCT